MEGGSKEKEIVVKEEEGRKAGRQEEGEDRRKEVDLVHSSNEVEIYMTWKATKFVQKSGMQHVLDIKQEAILIIIYSVPRTLYQILLIYWYRHHSLSIRKGK